MQWIKYTNLNLPPQGLKIICFKKGDVWICRRLHYKGKDYWIEIPYGGKNGVIATKVPDYWMELDLPEGATGYIKVIIDDCNPVTFDELEKTDPKSHEELVGMWIKQLDSQQKKKK